MSGREPPTPVPGAAHFATTHWSVVLQAGGVGGDADPAAATNALGRLYQVYWYPLYAYVRRQGHDAPTAQDVVQEVFLALLARRQLAQVSPERGRFRSYLLSAVNHLLANEWHKQHRQKRGNGVAPISLDSLEAEDRYRLEPIDARTPDQVYERRWALALLESVLAQLRDNWHAVGKGPTFDALRVYLSGDSDAPSFADLGARLGWTEGAARVAVHRLRQQYREQLREAIAETVSSPDEITDELRHLLAVLRA